VNPLKDKYWSVEKGYILPGDLIIQTIRHKYRVTEQLAKDLTLHDVQQLRHIGLRIYRPVKNPRDGKENLRKG
jgi:hypothetical protein